MESMKHEYAKRRVLEWCGKEAWAEYPVCATSAGELMGLSRASGELETWRATSWQEVPTYDECVRSGLLPLVVFDVLKRLDECFVAIEVVHTNGLSQEKLAYLGRIASRVPLRVYAVKAAWVHAQAKRPLMPWEMPTWRDWFDARAPGNGEPGTTEHDEFAAMAALAGLTHGWGTSENQKQYAAYLRDFLPHKRDFLMRVSKWSSPGAYEGEASRLLCLAAAREGLLPSWLA